jgi:hypothetical protein
MAQMTKHMCLYVGSVITWVNFIGIAGVTVRATVQKLKRGAVELHVEPCERLREMLTELAIKATRPLAAICGEGGKLWVTEEGLRAAASRGAIAVIGPRRQVAYLFVFRPVCSTLVSARNYSR